MAVYVSRALLGYEGQTIDLRVASKGGKAVISIEAIIYKFVLKLNILA
jgi:hypothetical protein